jgi:hypothetical protein
MEPTTDNLPAQPYHTEYGNYTYEDAKQIKKFMEEDIFPSFSIPRGPRDGKFVVEIPGIPEAEKFKHLVLSEIPDEIQSCHPLLRRRDIFVRFVSSLEEQRGGESIGTNADILDARENGKVKYYIRIAFSELQDLKGDNMVANLVGIIVHEIAETDYYLKSTDGLEDSKALLGTEGYGFTEDEEVSNRRAIRVLKRKYPDVGWNNLDYPIDKQ